MSTIFQKYAAALLPFFILVIGGSQTVFGQQGPFSWSAVLAFAILVVGAIASFVVKLLKAKWQGAAKTGIAILTTVLTALVPFVLPSGWDPHASWQLIIVGVLNAVATEFGVQIRTGDNAVSGGVVPDPASTPQHLASPATTVTALDAS